MRFPLVALILLASCEGQSESATGAISWRVDRAIRSATVVEGLWLAKPERATVTVAGMEVLRRVTLSDPQAAIAKGIVLNLNLHSCPGPPPFAVRPGDVCYADFALQFSGPRNAVVATFDSCLTCEVQGLGRCWTARYPVEVGRLVQLAYQLFPQHPRYLRWAQGRSIQRTTDGDD